MAFSRACLTVIVETRFLIMFVGICWAGLVCVRGSAADKELPDEKDGLRLVITNVEQRKDGYVVDYKLEWTKKDNPGDLRYVTAVLVTYFDSEFKPVGEEERANVILPAKFAEGKSLTFPDSVTLKVIPTDARYVTCRTFGLRSKPYKVPKK